MIYRLEKALDEGMRITKEENGEVVRKKYYSPHMTSRLAIPLHKTLGKTGKYDTGLTKSQEGELETLLGHEEGYLNDKSSFWGTFGIKIPAKGLVLNSEIPEDALVIAVVKGRVRTVGDIALSKADLRSNAKAKWLLSNEEAEAEVLTDSLSWLAKAAVKFDSMTLEDMENYLKSCSIDPRGMSAKIIKGKVGNDVKSSPKKFLTIANDKYMTDKIFIHELVAYGIIRMNRTNYLNEDGITVAYSVSEMLDFITNKTNAKQIIAWKKQLEEAKK